MLKKFSPGEIKESTLGWDLTMLHTALSSKIKPKKPKPPITVPRPERLRAQMHRTCYFYTLPTGIFQRTPTCETSLPFTKYSTATVALLLLLYYHDYSYCCDYLLS